MRTQCLCVARSGATMSTAWPIASPLATLRTCISDHLSRERCSKVDIYRNACSEYSTGVYAGRERRCRPRGPLRPLWPPCACTRQPGTWATLDGLRLHHCLSSFSGQRVEWTFSSLARRSAFTPPYVTCVTCITSPFTLVYANPGTPLCHPDHIPEYPISCKGSLSSRRQPENIIYLTSTVVACVWTVLLVLFAVLKCFPMLSVCDPALCASLSVSRLIGSPLQSGITNFHFPPEI